MINICTYFSDYIFGIYVMMSFMYLNLKCSETVRPNSNPTACVIKYREMLHHRSEIKRKGKGKGEGETPSGNSFTHSRARCNPMQQILSISWLFFFRCSSFSASFTNEQ